VVFSLVGWTFGEIIAVMGVIGLPGLFALMTVESLGLPPLPSEVILPFAGVLLAEGTLYFSWPAVILVSLVGSLTGAALAYELGRWGGPMVIHRWGRRVGLSDRDLHRAEEFFAHRGEYTVLVARMIPLLRAYISYPAGAAQMDRRIFLGLTAVGTLPFIVAMVYIGTVLGKNISVLQSYFTVLDVVVVIGVAGGVAAYLLRARRASRETPTA
jgi:membrane protein DedA with SNARE-associated domain